MLATVLAGVLALANGICTTGSTRTCKLAGCASARQVCLPDRTWDICRCGCDDGNACTQDALSGGQCVHTPIVADDGNPCTVDSCDPVLGITHQPALSGTPCSDVDVCAGGSACDGWLTALSTFLGDVMGYQFELEYRRRHPVQCR